MSNDQPDVAEMWAMTITCLKVSTDDNDLQDGELEDFPGEFNE